MGSLKNITTERLPSTVSDLVLNNKWRREFLDLVEQPQKYGVHVREGHPPSLPAWAQLGLDGTPLQYAPKLRGGYAAKEKSVRHYLRRPKQVHFCTGLSANFDQVICLIYVPFAERKLKQSPFCSNYPQKCMFSAQKRIC